MPSYLLQPVYYVVLDGDLVGHALGDAHRRLQVQQLAEVEQQVEVGEALEAVLHGLGGLHVALEVLVLGVLAEAVHAGEVVALDYVELHVVLVRLPVRQRDQEEVGVELLHRRALLQHRRHRLLVSRLPDLHFLGVAALAQHAVPLQRLALVRGHVALDADLVLVRVLGLHHHGHELGDLVAVGVVDDVLLLEGGRLPQLRGGHEHLVLVQSREDVAHAFEAEGLGDHVGLLAERVLERLDAVDVTDLRRLVDGLDVEADAVGEVRVL
mmetsp:Transcript_83/g.159  ORF Transcript_83/g.159 Transcript_83/m.159 type:complete len:268 (-) Transcript_83:921-1724(-)